ncbi:MAG: hypothetical protein AAFY88_05090, partial [Acidobacteriota bacterium]
MKKKRRRSGPGSEDTRNDAEQSDAAKASDTPRESEPGAALPDESVGESTASGDQSTDSQKTTDSQSPAKRSLPAFGFAADLLKKASDTGSEPDPVPAAPGRDAATPPSSTEPAGGLGIGDRFTGLGDATSLEGAPTR